MKHLLFTAIVLFILSCGNPSKSSQVFTVEYKGALKEIMHKGDLSTKMELSKLQGVKNLFALGAIENLKGEVQIFNGNPSNTFVKNDKIMFDRTYSKNATLLVSSVVANWSSFQIPSTVKTKEELEKYIEKIAAKNQIDTKEPFPFLIDGKPESLNWHVINWKDGDLEHSHEKHIASGLNGTLKNQKVEMLGFYSDSHHAIFTHHTTNMHIHMKMVNGEIAGHVDNLILGKEMILKLPKIE